MAYTSSENSPEILKCTYLNMDFTHPLTLLRDLFKGGYMPLLQANEYISMCRQEGLEYRKKF